MVKRIPAVLIIVPYCFSVHQVIKHSESLGSMKKVQELLKAQLSKRLLLQGSKKLLFQLALGRSTCSSRILLVLDNSWFALLMI